MQCSSFIEHAVAVEHLVRQNKLTNYTGSCGDLDTTIKTSSGQLCYINRLYIFPIQFFLGITGNLLSICVFNRKSMRNVTNYFLACIALADMGFFISLLASSLIIFPGLRTSSGFKDFYYYSYPYLLMFANFFSALSLWSAVGVTAQRLIAVHCPLKVQLIFNQYRLIFATLAASVISLPMSSFKFFQGSNIQESCEVDPKPASLTFKILSLIFLAVLIFTPIILVIIFNILLVFALKYNYHKMSRQVQRSHLAKLRNLRRRTDRRITILVMLTSISCITLNFPSVMIGALRIIYGGHWLATKPTVIVPLSNILVATDKTFHFFFFCCSSKFRNGLKHLLTHEESSHISMTSKKCSESGHSFSSKHSIQAVDTMVREDEIELLPRSRSCIPSASPRIRTISVGEKVGVVCDTSGVKENVIKLLPRISLETSRSASDIVL